MNAEMFPPDLRARLRVLTDARRTRVIERACIIHEGDLSTWQEACERALTEEK